MIGSKDRPKCIRGGRQETLSAMYNGQLMTSREIAGLLGLSPKTVRNRISAGLPVKAERKKPAARTYLYNGKQMTAAEIAPLVCLSAKTVTHRLKRGQPLERKRSDLIARVPYGDRMMTVTEICRETGYSRGMIYHRLDNGIPLDAPVDRRRQRKAGRKSPLTESGERRISSGAGENGLYWRDDLEAIIWHLYCGGDDFGECTLEEIGALWDMSRERIRQIEKQAIARIRHKALGGDEDACNALRYFRERSEQRSTASLSVWEQAEMNAPGSFDLSWWNESTSHTDIAQSFGDDAYASLPHVEAARRGGAKSSAAASSKEPA